MAFTNPREHHPETQRALMPLQTSSVVVTTDSTDVFTHESIDASSTLYVWGLSFCTSSTELVTCDLKTDSGGDSLVKFGASRNSSYMNFFPAPIRVPRGDGIKLTNAAPAAVAQQLSSTVSVMTIWYNKILDSGV